jgi:hypothetical protein
LRLLRSGVVSARDLRKGGHDDPKHRYCRHARRPQRHSDHDHDDPERRSLEPIVPEAPGYPYIAGQAFVRSNSDGIAWTGINSYPICEDASNNARLACQWDEIATRRENRDDGTWRHASLTVLLPPDSPQYTNVRGGRGLAACTSSPCPGIFKVAFANTSGTYAPAIHGSIADVCNGHDIKPELNS